MNYIIIEATFIGLGAMIGAFIGTLLGNALHSWRKRRAIRQMTAILEPLPENPNDQTQTTSYPRPTTRGPYLD